LIDVRVRAPTNRQQRELEKSRQDKKKSDSPQGSGFKKIVGRRATILLDEETLEIKDKMNANKGSFSALVRDAIKYVADSAENETPTLSRKMSEEWGEVLTALAKSHDLTYEEVKERVPSIASHHELGLRLRQLQVSGLVSERRGRWNLTGEGKRAIDESLRTQTIASQQSSRKASTQQTPSL
jgi:hypothetical protein